MKKGVHHLGLATHDMEATSATETTGPSLRDRELAPRRFARAGILVAALLASSACSTTKLLDFTVISTHSVELVDNPRLELGQKRVRGESTESMILIFPVGRLDVAEAISRAISSEPACVALLNGSIVREDRVLLPFVFMESKIVVEGTPLVEGGSP